MSETFGIASTQAARDVTSEHLLVPVAARAIPLQRAPIVVALGAVYAVLCSLHPIYGDSVSSVAMLTALTMLTSAYALMSPNQDILDPMRVVSFYYLIIFCIAPLGETEVSWHYTRPYVALLPGAVGFAVAAYLMFLVGYHLPIFRPLPRSIPSRHESFDKSVVTILSIVTFVIGFVSWVALVLLAGGVDGLIYSETSRGEFFFGFGYFFWGALFMFGGATMYWASRCVDAEKVPWRHAFILVIAFVAFLILQGRMRALNFLILGIFISHYLVKPVRPSRFALFGLAGGLLALFVGVARAPSTRAEAFQDPIGTMFSIFANLDVVGRAFIASDLSRVRQLVLILDKVPAWMPHDWGQSYLIIWNPFMRLLGLTEFGGIEGIGPRLFRLAHPDIGFLPTGYLPSFVGEALVNFPWYAAWMVFIPYGILIRLLYAHLIVRRADFVGVAMYSILLLQAANIMLQSFGHVVFEMIVVLSPIFIVQLVARRRKRNVPVELSDATAA